MTTIKKTFGKLSMYKGDYTSGVAYKYRNRVTLYGCEFESKIDNNTYAPATIVGDDITFDTVHWNVVSNAKDAYLAAQKIATLETKMAGLEDGSLQAASAKLADNITSWEGRDELSVEDPWTDPVRTTAGDVSINSENGGKLVKITPLTDYYATGLVSGGFNRLRNATHIGSGETWVLDGDMLPALPQGDGTPQGIILTDANGVDIGTLATVYYKATAPSAGSLGTAITPVVKVVSGKTVRFFPTTAAGFITVAFTGQATRATSCAHIGWSRRWWDYVSVNDASDDGQTVDLSGLMSAQNPLHVITTDVKDYINVVGTTATRHTVCASVTVSASSWHNATGDTEGTYVHTAVITGMKSNGVARLGNGTILSVNGTSVSFTDDNSSVSAALEVVYELATPTTSTVTNIYGAGNSVFKLEDWGIERQAGANGTAEFTTAYAQGYADSLAAIARIKVKELKEQSEDNAQSIAELTAALYDEMAKDPDMKNGQPRLLFGEGTPQEAVVPTNWRQLSDGGYNWIGRPAFVGQRYINTAVTTGGEYVGYLDSGFELQWRTIVG